MTPAPLVIGVAPNGARLRKADHPAVPLAAEEIAETAARCADAGAAFLHLHVRDKRGEHTLDAEAYREAIAAVRRRRREDELALQITTESGGRYGPAAQRELVYELVPEAVSLALRELVPSPAEETEAAALFSWIDERGIAPQYILYTPEEVAYFEELLARGAIPDRAFWVLFVLGGRGRPAEPADLLPFLQAKTSSYPWAVCAFGSREAACALTAAGLGGHARVGFENNTVTTSGAIARENAELVAEIRDGARYLGRRAARAAALPDAARPAPGD